MEILKLKVDSSKMNAYLNIPRRIALKGNITFERVLKYLKNSGIVFGINEETISKIIDRKLWNKRIKVATGQTPVKGEDGREEYYFKAVNELTPKLLEDGSVDFKDLQLAQNVKAGQIIAKLIKPTKGISGMNIYGEEVHAEPGTEGYLIAGTNTEFKDEEQNILVASVDGNVKLRLGNTVVVHTVYQVDKDVDFSTGNLDVTGDVYIRGDVLSVSKLNQQEMLLLMEPLRMQLLKPTVI